MERLDSLVDAAAACLNTFNSIFAIATIIIKYEIWSNDVAGWVRAIASLSIAYSSVVYNNSGVSAGARLLNITILARYGRDQLSANNVISEAA